MECPHLSATVCVAVDPNRFPHGSPSSWCCSVCRSNKSPWVCLTCLNVHCGRYVNGHAKKHFEEVQCSPTGQKKTEKLQQHSVCMDCSSYSTFCYRCDDFVVNDTKLGQVQRVREHLQSLEISVMTSDRQRKRKLSGSSSPDLRMPADGEGPPARSATGLRNLGNTCFMNAILQSLGYRFLLNLWGCRASMVCHTEAGMQPNPLWCCVEGKQKAGTLSSQLLLMDAKNTRLTALTS